MPQETPSADIGDLWDIYQNTKAQLFAVTAEKLAVLSQLTTLRLSGDVDAVSKSQGGEGGNESVTIVTLQARFDSLVRAEIEISKMLYEQRLHAIKASPGFSVARVPTIGGRCGLIY